MKWEIVMGIEVHAELSTKSKIFCGCSTEFGGAPNTNVCPVCSGMPGALPVFNYAVLEYAIKLGLTLGCEITRFSKFDRKNYFYPDLPKAYQISQLYSPICTLGHLNIDGDGFSKSIGISEIHMEEDAGKLIHNLQTGNTLMNYNRCGVPLLEIVSQPDFRSAGEVIAYLEKLREILLYLDICDCKMQEGSIRADVNISVRPFGGQLGVRTEMKNLNSFKEISRAIEYESNRQIEILESGGEIEQETRRWDDAVGMSVGMRSKENAQDYRYFPEPDLLPLQVDESLIKKIGANLPELAHQKCERYIAQFGLTKYDATLITKYKNITILFESVAHLSGEPVEAANLITGELMRLMNKTGTQPEDLKIDSQKLADLIALVTGGKINRTAYKETVEAVYLSDVEPNAYIEEKGLLMLADTDIVTSAVKSVLE
ncbi:MAG: Asp-tRNA(Asn)/Glu-tRNA(Gln) amidotransferase subunit GatB, partial [Oscillospiraceae bacterium]|nr:Asp-tRNA(Asn)/Glu-tRNA(Gln) amidotransferase subunit GatB [Oscillospiraceae bacterium]